MNTHSIRVLVVTNLFPNKKELYRGIFIHQAVLELKKMCDLQVIAPLPWFPKFLYKLGFNCLYKDVPSLDQIDGVNVSYPRWFVFPRFFRCLYGFFIFFSVYPQIAKANKEFKFDVVYAPWVYPDGFAVVLAAKILRKPVVLRAMGCDVNHYSTFFWRRLMIRWALRNADGIVSVSDALKNRMVELGTVPSKIEVVRNGVNKDLFYAMDKINIRKQLKLGTEVQYILFIGSWEEVKGVEYLLEAFRLLKMAGFDNVKLLMIGKGYLENEIRQKVAQWALNDSILLIGPVSHKAIPLWMNAADVFCLPSIREGMPNVVLEALACGVSIVATSVGGIPEILVPNDRNILVPARDSKKLFEAFSRLLKQTECCNPLNVDNSVLSWHEHARKLFGVFSKIEKKRN
jgi:glycosyltransferase involved in cell wall biosynthesis